MTESGKVIKLSLGFQRVLVLSQASQNTLVAITEPLWALLSRALG